MEPKRSILIVDDEQPTVDSLQLILQNEFSFLVAGKGEEALELVKSEPVDLVFLDIALPGIDGFEVLKEIKKYDSSIEVVMLTADDKAKTALRALESGAFHYITKPYNKDDILLVTRRVFEKKNMAEEIVSLRDEVEERDSFHNIIGQDPKMRELYKLVTKIALTDSTVLLTGESGTGKELVAKAVHFQSSRKDKHFKAINCGSIPETLLESELFGHEKGSYTGALERKIGKFEMASGGTIFLDEISAMKETMQVKLLRVLQEREIERVGGMKTIPIDVRVIAASNSNLQRLVEKDQFRQDLYYRLNVIHIHLPPLRDRKGDIILLAEHFLKFFARRFNKSIKGFSQDARVTMENYPWLGNVRELRNVMERAVVLGEEEWITLSHLPLDLAIPPEDLNQIKESFSLKAAVDQYEKKLILNVLERAGWNQTKAAELLGIHRNTLIAKMDSFEINVRQLKGDKESRVYS